MNKKVEIFEIGPESGFVRLKNVHNNRIAMCVKSLSFEVHVNLMFHINIQKITFT